MKLFKLYYFKDILNNLNIIGKIHVMLLVLKISNTKIGFKTICLNYLFKVQAWSQSFLHLDT